MKFRKSLSLALLIILCFTTVLTGCKEDAGQPVDSKPEQNTDIFQSVDTDSTNSNDGSSVDSSSTDSKPVANNSSVASTTSSNNTNVTTSQADAMKGQIDLKGKTLTMLYPSEDAQMAKRFKEFCNGNIKFVVASYSDMKNVLATKVMSNQAPDIYFMTNQDYPTVLYKDLLQPLNQMLDFNSSLWSPIKPIMDQYKWSDGNYYFVGEYELGNSFMWNKKIFADAGVTETPATLMAKDQWNWDTFLDLMKKVSDVKNGIYGFGTEHNFCYACLASAGEDIVYMDSKKGLVNNVNSANVAKAMDFMQKAYDTKYTFAGDGYPIFSKGKMAMFYGYSGHGSDKHYVDQLNTGNYAFALFPKMPGSKGYSLPGTTTGYGIPKGAKNVDCALAFLIMNRVDTAYKDTLDKEYMQKNGLTKTNFLEINNLIAQQKRVSIVSLGVDKINQVYWPVESKVRGGTPWASLKEQLSPNVDKAIQSLQKK